MALEAELLYDMLKQREVLAMRKQKLRYFLLPLALIALLFAIDIFYLSPMNIEKVPSAFPAFSTTDLECQTHNEEIFANQLTLVCLWVTTDAQSVNMLANLAAWQEREGSTVQLIGLVGNVKEDSPAEILAQAKTMSDGLPKRFPQLLTNDSLAPFLTTIKAAPTFVFVNKQGQIVGQPIAGWEMELIKKEAHRILFADSPEAKQKNHLLSQLLR